MCGLIGFFGRPGWDADGAAIDRALVRMTPRGPDGEGRWLGGDVALGHRRLAIVDLDQRSAQPLSSACGRYRVVFNGEIYNYRELRRHAESLGATFRTESDTEVLLALYALEGDAMLDRLLGMFAFVIWDRVERSAFAARDPYGIKPLFLAETPEGVWMASQVKALVATRRVRLDPDPDAVAAFWMLGSVAEPRTWFAGVRAVAAGECLWVREGRVVRRRHWASIGRAWDAGDRASRLAPAPLQAKVSDALHESVRRHLVADVPVGVFLSGGIDSGALAGLMVDCGARDVQGVTIAYDEFGGRPEDEVPAAAEIARHYGIRHHVRRVTRDEFLADLPRILDAMDQPSVDGVNTWFAAKAVAEQGLKVVVSGVGGDELFFGYGMFRQLPRLIALRSWLARAPGGLAVGRGVQKRLASRSGNNRWLHAEDWLRSVQGAWWLRRGVYAPDDLPRLMGDRTVPASAFSLDVDSMVDEMVGALPTDATLALAQIESMTYLRNQLLRDSDWASMAHSVELRTPLVDANLLANLSGCLAQMARVPGKRLLANAPRRPLPQSIFRRRKTGFGIPVARWVREAQLVEDGVGPSQGWAKLVARRCILSEPEVAAVTP